MPDIIPQDSTPHKQCTACNEIFPATLEYFHSQIRGKYGVRSICKQCMREYYDRIKKRSKVVPPDFIVCIACGESKSATSEFFGKNSKAPNGFYTKCKECINAYNRQSRRDDPDSQAKQRVRVRHWRTLNPERNEFLRKRGRAQEHRKAQERAYAKQHRLANLDYYRDWHRRYRTTDKFKSYLKSYHQREDTRKKQRINEHNKRVRFYSAPGRHAAQDIQQKLLTQKHCCYYCDSKFEKHGTKYLYHVDHVVPLSRGGSNWPDNIVLACPFCNQSKGAKFLHEWEQGGRLF